MPGHGLISLVAYGSQDLYLTGNPQITFWKVVYKRYTNFAMESVPQPLTGNVDFGQRFSAVISRNVGDLAHKCLLQLTIPALTYAQTALGTVRWVDKLGHAIIDWYELVIGGTVIDHQYGEWLEIYSQLTLPPSKLGAYNRMIGHTTALLSSATSAPAVLYIPLQFFFCQTPGLALPLVSLQYHDVRINFQLKPLEDLIIQSIQTDVYQGSIVDATLYVDYVYLDVQERQQFAARRHEYLITQVQYNGAEPVVQTSTSTTSKAPVVSNIYLNFNHPCKYIVWVTQKAEFMSTVNNQTFNYTDQLQDRSKTATFDSPIELNNLVAKGPLLSNTLVLNGHTRYDVRTGDTFNHVQTYYHFPNCLDSPGIYVYSFALHPTDAQPSGSNNFSRIDSAILRNEYPSTYLIDSSNTVSTATTRVYAVCVNVLRVMSGLAGIAYCQ